MMRVLQAMLFAVVAWMAMAAPASAGCVGVNCSCSVNPAPLTFGAYVPTSGTDVKVAADISVTCKAFVLGLFISYEIHLGPGIYGTVADRKMSNGSSLLSYNIFTTTGRTIVWGDGTNGTGMGSNGYLLALGASRTDTVQMFGKIVAGQNVSAGSYTDTVVATVVY